VTVVLDQAIMTDKPTYEALLKVLVEKFGPFSKSADVEHYQIMWAHGGGHSAKLWKIGRDVVFEYSF